MWLSGTFPTEWTGGSIRVPGQVFKQDVNLEFSSVLLVQLGLLTGRHANWSRLSSSWLYYWVCCWWVITNMFYHASYLFFTVIMMIRILFIIMTSFGILIFRWAIEPMAWCKCIACLSSTIEPGYYWLSSLLSCHGANDLMHHFNWSFFFNGLYWINYFGGLRFANYLTAVQI